MPKKNSINKKTPKKDKKVNKKIKKSAKKVSPNPSKIETDTLAKSTVNSNLSIKKESKKSQKDLEKLATKSETKKTIEMADSSTILTNPINKEKNQNTTNNQTNTESSKENFNGTFTYKIMMIIISLFFISGILLFNFYTIPDQILRQTDDIKALEAKQQSESQASQKSAEIKKILEEENQVLNFQNQNISLEIENFGKIEIEMLDQIAPKTTENFIRLVHRDYYDGTIFHRMVESPEFNVIQGGDPTGTGQGGESAFGEGETILDELWKVEPEVELDPNTNQQIITNQPEFTDSAFYLNFDDTTGQVTYPKGLMLMAKTSRPDSAESQFFITLTDTVLPAQYTVFGKIKESNIDILDKIIQEVDPESQSETVGTEEEQIEYKDGKPNQELKILEAKIL